MVQHESKHIKTTQSLIIDLSALHCPITFSYIVLILYSPNQSLFNYIMNCYSEISGLNCVLYKQCQERPKHLQCSLLIGQCKLKLLFSPPLVGPFVFRLSVGLGLNWTFVAEGSRLLALNQQKHQSLFIINRRVTEDQILNSTQFKM